MSNLQGHFRITQTAVVELARSRALSPIAQGVQWASLPQAAVARDLMDVLCLGHWADFGQAHHFMRRFDGQSPYGAYQEAIEWIHSNALSATRTLAFRIASYFPNGIQGKRADRIRAQFVFQDIPWQSLGNAIHCLEDSFAVGHVVRGSSNDILRPGEIEHIKRYAGTEKEHHEEGDEAWWDETQQRFSQSGRQAIEAVKALLTLVLHTAMHNRPPQSLEGWKGYIDQWLVASKKLSSSSDHVFELIDRHYVGIRVGANNVATVSFDEDGLANDLVAEPTSTVFQVFERLDDHFNSDADDVAEIYVNKVRDLGGTSQEALKQNKPLIKLLIKVMEEGWTSQGEADCINYLRSL